MSTRSTRSETLYGVIGEIRRLFHQLAREADEMHADLDITASQRAVLESLAQAGATTVPAVARAKSVSRQHIQGLANQLAERGFVDAVQNPAHRRSALIELTNEGQKVFQEMRERETQRIGEIAWHLSRDDLERTGRTLRELSRIIRDTEV